MDAQNKRITLVVTQDEAGMRLDRYLSKHFAHQALSFLQKTLRKKWVLVNDLKMSDPACLIASGMRICVPAWLQDSPREQESREERQEKSSTVDLQKLVIYEDQEILALNKPHGLFVQGGFGIKQHIDGNLWQLQSSFPQPPRLVHRLDQETSGLLLLARTRQASVALSAMFSGREIKKCYVALMFWPSEGDVPHGKRGVIDVPLIKHGGDKQAATLVRLAPCGKHHYPEHLCEKEVSRHFARRKEAVTHYEILSTKLVKSGVVGLCLMAPQTGRTHQLRMHAKAMGGVILGDARYGGMKSLLALQKDGFALERRLYLHALAVKFSSHKLVTGASLLEAPLGEGFQHAIRSFSFSLVASQIEAMLQ